MITKKRTFIGFTIFLLLFSMIPSLVQADNGNSSPAKQVDLITRVTSSGEKVIAVAIEYRKKIDGKALSPSAFAVHAATNGVSSPRTITNIYAHSGPETTTSPQAGKYVILELDPRDANASTLIWDQANFRNVRADLDYSVVQEEDIHPEHGNPIPASPEIYKPTREINLVVQHFMKKEITNPETGLTLPYRFFEPKVEKDRKYPLVLFLHGAGERGSGNDVQLLANKGAVVWAEQTQHPAYVLAPQAPAGSDWTRADVYASLLQLLAEVQAKHPIDPDRIYVNGISLGAFGTWNLIQHRPNLFAAAISISGAGDVSGAAAIKHIPLWVFHAEDDDIVPVAGSRNMVEALRAVGSDVRYTEYPAGTVIPSHASWAPAYENEETIRWLFDQRK